MDYIGGYLDLFSGDMDLIQATIPRRQTAIDDQLSYSHTPKEFDGKF